jgi:hypothetical protein
VVPSHRATRSRSGRSGRRWSALPERRTYRRR